MQNKGILLINLGTPKNLSRIEVYKYLREFLMDPMVLDLPYIYRFALVNFVIAPFRSKSSYLKYKSIWDGGSPLLIYSEKLRSKMEAHANLPVKLAMRYGEPSIKSAVTAFLSQGIQNIKVLPMYPHRALSSSETAKKAFLKYKGSLKFEFIDCFYNHPKYTKLLGDHIREHLAHDEHLLLSYHSIPERHILKEFSDCRNCLDKIPCEKANSNCYRNQCFSTSKLLGEYLGTDNYSVGFQSRLGSTPWIKPYTDLLIKQLSNRKIKKLSVFSPSFLADCLETLEEIDILYRKEFLQAGGEKFSYIPCLNDHDGLSEFLLELCSV